MKLCIYQKIAGYVREGGKTQAISCNDWNHSAFYAAGVENNLKDSSGGPVVKKLPASAGNML